MATYNGQVTGGGLNMRKSASTSSTKLTQIPDETKIVVSDYSGNSSWYCTTYGSYSGFVMKQYVTILSNATSQSATVTGGGLNLRTYPSTSASSPVQIPNNTKITVQKHNASWSSTTYNGHSGFVMTQYLTIGGSTGGGETGGGDTGGGSTGTTKAPSLTDIRNGNAYLTIGHYGDSVTTLRRYLNGHGYTCNSSGAYDDALKSVVKNYQKANGISADGLAGQATFALLEDEISDTGWFSGQGTCMLTAGKLVRIGFTGKLALRPDNVKLLNDAINDSRFNFTKKIHIRHFLAQACKETDCGKTFTEYKYVAGRTKAAYNGDPKYAPYCGGGFMQLTHDYNYEDFKNYVNDSKVYTPEEYATQYVANNYPYISAAWFWCVLNDLNKTIDAYDNKSADATVKEVTRIVKGDSSNYSARLEFYENAKTVLK